MARLSPVHYINPTTVAITPNANGSENDLAVSVAQGAKIKVFSPAFSALGWTDENTYMEWTLSGRNRRLADSNVPYTIYARLPKTDFTAGYIVFAPKSNVDGEWKDKYIYVTENGWGKAQERGSSVYWYIRLGEVSLPENGRRTLTFDTGVLGTDQYNSEYNLDPDDMPLRVVLACSIEGEDAGNTPYVNWGKSLILRATLLEGWGKDVTERIDHWTISRNTGDEAADPDWPSEERAAAFGRSGNIALSHARGAGDDFNGAVSTIFTVTAWGRKEEESSSSASSTSSSASSSSDSGEIVALASASITIMAETVEKMELELSRNIVNYNPQTDVYYPVEGIKVRIRAIDQKGNVFILTKGQFDNAGIAVQIALAGSEQWTDLVYSGTETAVAEATIPVEIFHAQQNVNVRIVRLMDGEAEGETIDSELTRQSVAFLRDGEDSRDREWIYIRSESQIVFDTPEHPLPSNISGGEVEPEGEAGGEDTNKQQAGWVPEGWWDEMRGTDDIYHYEYAAYRDFERTDGTSSDSDSGSSSSSTGKRWGDFSTPKIWSYYAEDGVSYRCRWTLAGTEIWQLTAAYTGAFRGTLPLVATLMKRTGDGTEVEVVASSVTIHVKCEGLPYQKYIDAESPQFIISDIVNKEFIEFLNSVELNGLSITFTIDGEDYHFSIPVIREADEDSVRRTVNEYGSAKFLSKLYDDIAQGKITFSDLAAFVNGLKIGGLNSIYGITPEAVATLIEIVSDNYTGNGLSDTGFRLHKNPVDGATSLVVDNLLVRMKAVFAELEIRKMSYSGGNIIFSHAGSKVVRVEAVYGDKTGMWFEGNRLIISDAIFGEGGITIPTAIYDGGELKNDFGGQPLTAYRCYLMKDDGSTQTENWWRVGDQARCQTFNIKEGVYENVSNSFYWRLVTATGVAVLEDGKAYDYIDLSATDHWAPDTENNGKIEGVDLSDTTKYETLPQAGDQLVQMGNRGYDAEGLRRQGFITLEVSGENAPAFKVYKGVNSYSLDNKRKICLSPALSDLRVQKLVIETEYDARQVPMERGAWDNICETDDSGTVLNRHRCYYYNLAQHNGATWLCTYPESGIGGLLYTTEEPSPTALYWRIYAEKGEQGASTTVKGAAKIHFDTWQELLDATRSGAYTPAENDIVLLDSSLGYEETYEEERHRGEERPTILKFVNGPDYTWEIQFPSLLDGWTINGYLWVAQEEEWYMSGKWGGDDAINVMLTPESIILNQNLTTKQIDLSQAYADVSVIKGSESLAGFTCTIGTGAEAPVHCNASVNGNRITITGIHSNSGQYYDNGSVTIKVSYNGNTYTKVFRFYANLLGTWKETVENDTRTAVAAMKYWVYDKDGSPVEQKNIAEFIQSSSVNQSTIESTVGGLAGNGGNILAGSELFPADTKLEHISTQADGAIEYPQGSSPAIYGAVQLVAGKTYILQIKSDGTLASAHDGSGGTQVGKYTVWLRINGTIDGEPYNGHCFTLANRTGILDDGALWWRFKCRLTGTYWLRTNTYSDGTTPVTVHFWDLMLEQSTIPSGWSAPSSRIISQIKQTASTIEASVTTKLGETGIKIDGNNRLIDLSAAQVRMSADGETQTIVEGGKLKTSLIDADKIVANGIKGKTIDAEDATFKNILVSGGLRSPFTHVASGERLDTQFNDNVVVLSNGIAVYGLPWDVSQSGRRVIVTNYKWGTDTQAMTGYAQLQAPTGKYFFEDGLLKEHIQLSRESVELIGYGDSESFYGWIVQSRVNIGTHYRYGHQLNVLSMGFVSMSLRDGSITPGLQGYSFDGTKPTVTRNSTGDFLVELGSTAWVDNEFFLHVIVSGFRAYDRGTGSTAAAFPYVYDQTDHSFSVRVSNGSSLIDCGFRFMVINLDDWMYLNTAKASESYNDGGGAWNDGGGTIIDVL